MITYMNQVLNTKFNNIHNIPLYCEWCNSDLITYENNSIYYNTIIHEFFVIKSLVLLFPKFDIHL